jgi:hypothetical protein
VQLSAVPCEDQSRVELVEEPWRGTPGTARGSEVVMLAVSRDVGVWKRYPWFLFGLVYNATEDIAMGASRHLTMICESVVNIRWHCVSPAFVNAHEISCGVFTARFTVND